MERVTVESPAGFVELGTASTATQGMGGIYIEHEGWEMIPALSDD